MAMGVMAVVNNLDLDVVKDIATEGFENSPQHAAEKVPLLTMDNFHIKKWVTLLQQKLTQRCNVKEQ